MSRGPRVGAMDAAPPADRRRRLGLALLRFGLPAALTVAGVAILVFDEGSRRFDGFAMCVGAALSLLFLTAVFTMGAKGDLERDDEAAPASTSRPTGTGPTRSRRPAGCAADGPAAPGRARGGGGLHARRRRDLYKAKMYGPRATDPAEMREGSSACTRPRSSACATLVPNRRAVSRSPRPRSRSRT